MHSRMNLATALRRCAAAGGALLILSLAAVNGAQTPTPPADPDVRTVVDKILTSAEHPGLTWGNIADVATDLAPLYEAETDRLLWFNGTAPIAAVERTVAALGAAEEHGLSPADYDAAALATQLAALKSGRAAAADRALFDVSLSVGAARMLRGVHLGRVDPAMLRWGYHIERKAADGAALLREVREGKGLAALLDELQPPVSHYARARKTLAAYRALLKRGEPERIPQLPQGKRKIQAGETWPGLTQLAARLRTLGDIATPANAPAPANYSPPLVEAVKRFQGRHGLEMDGVIGAGTIKAMNVTLAQRIRQIELAMERKRWLPPLSDRANIFVNVPLFRLWATDPKSGAEPLRLRVVV